MFIELTDNNNGRKFLINVKHISQVMVDVDGECLVLLDDDSILDIKENYSALKMLLQAVVNR